MLLDFVRSGHQQQAVCMKTSLQCRAG